MFLNGPGDSEGEGVGPVENHTDELLEGLLNIQSHDELKAHPDTRIELGAIVLPTDRTERLPLLVQSSELLYWYVLYQF